MRAILNISLPAEEKKKIERRAKKAQMTISSYILYNIHVTENLISEDELFDIALQAEKDYRRGKTKELKSLKDLML